MRCTIEILASFLLAAIADPLGMLPTLTNAVVVPGTGTRLVLVLGRVEVPSAEIAVFPPAMSPGAPGCRAQIARDTLES